MISIDSKNTFLIKSQAFGASNPVTDDKISLDIKIEMDSHKYMSDLEMKRTEKENAISKALDEKRVARLENTRGAAVTTIKLDVCIKIRINSQPLFMTDQQDAWSSRARQYELDATQYPGYSSISSFLEGESREMWSSAREMVGQANEAWAVNPALYWNNEWRGGELDFASPRVIGKLEEDGAGAAMTISRTLLRGDDPDCLKRPLYAGWYQRNVESGRLGRYLVEYNIDLISKPFDESEDLHYLQ